MRTELLKVIEGGLEKNPEKVKSYAKIIADKLKKNGEIKYSDRINKLLNDKTVHPVYLDEFMAKPVDNDSRLSMVDVTMDNKEENLILPAITVEKISNYIDSIKYKDKFVSMGIDLPDSLLLYGLPGCGKTSIAHYIADKIGLPLVTAKLDGMISSLLGSTAKNIRKIFNYAQEHPCVLFLDEFDAVAKARDDSHEVGELKRVVNSLLQNIDSFNENNILIAATNHENLLDPAIWRRFSNIIEIPTPTNKEIEKLLSTYIKAIETDFLNDKKRIKLLSNILVGLSPAVIKTLCYNSIKTSILNDQKRLLYSTFLHQFYLSKFAGNNDLRSLIIFLHQSGVTQVSIAEELKISQRQVRNILKDEDDDQNG